MYRIHDRTRRLLCRLGFLAFCLAPTLTILTWIGIVRSPAYTAHRLADWEQMLSQRLGLSVTLQRIAHPTRGVTLLEGIELSDVETGAPIARVRQLEMGRASGRLILLVSQPELQGDRMWRLWEVLHQRILRSRVAERLPTQLVAGELTIHRADGQHASTLTDVRCQLVPTREGPQAIIEFRDVALQMAEPAQVRITRNRQVSPPATQWELQTRSTALPCALLADQVDALAWLGNEATFQGSVRAMPVGGGWEGELAGRFRNVDLDRLISDRYPHKLSGMAEIELKRARFRDGKLIDAAGEVASAGGVISWSLMEQARKTLGLIADARVRADDTTALWPYQQLKFGFALTEKGLCITGRCDPCDSEAQAVVLADRHGALLCEKPHEIAQVVALVRALAPEHGEQVPATPEAYQLLHVLPIPSQRPVPASTSSRRIYSPLRLR